MMRWPGRRRCRRGIALVAVTVAVTSCASGTAPGEGPSVAPTSPTGSVPEPGAPEPSPSPSSQPDHPADDRLAHGGATIAPDPSNPSTPPADTAGRRFDVDVTERTFIDQQRGRTLRTHLLYPASVPPDVGPFPLVLFAHGFRLPADGYDRMLTALAAHGYVVAVPDFPHTTARGGDGDRRDIVNQPADLSFVADQVIALGAAATTPIPAIAHPERLAVAGHSDGGLTATAWAFNAGYRDHRVVAAVSLTGGIGMFGGRYDAADPPSLLLVHGTGDATNPFAASLDAFNRLAAPTKHLVAIEDGDHIGPYMFATGREDLGDLMATFFDGTGGGDPGAADRFQRLVSTSPGLRLAA